MTRLVQLVLFSAWLFGAVTGGLTVAPEQPSATASVRVVAATDWAKLTVQAGQIVLTVGQGERRWRAASPLPSVLRAWLPDTGKSAPESRRMPLGGTPVIPL